MILEKKKILIISQYFWPNNFRINDILSNLSDKKYEITIICANTNYIKKNKFPKFELKKKKFQKKNFNILSVPVLHRKSSSFFSIILHYFSFIFSGIYYGNKNLNNKKFDKIFIYGTSPILQAFVGLYFKKKFKAPIVLWVQDLWPESIYFTGYIKNNFFLNLIKYFVGIIYNNSNIILAQSKGFIKLIKNNCSHKNIYYLPNPVNKIYTTKTRYKLKKGFNVVYTGNFGVAQNVENIIKSANKLKRYDNINFYFFGDTSKGKYLIELKKKLNLSNCFFPGYINNQEYFSILKQSSLLIFGLKKNIIWSNTIPSKFQSYLLSGRPILGYIDGITANIINEVKCGYTVKPHDYIEISNTIKKMSKYSKKRLNKMGHNGKIYCIKNYNLKKITAKLESFIANV